MDQALQRGDQDHSAGGTRQEMEAGQDSFCAAVSTAHFFCPFVNKIQNVCLVV